MASRLSLRSRSEPPQDRSNRLFSFITANRRGKPLVSHKVIVELIAATATEAGLTVRCQLDPNAYPAGVKASEAQLNTVKLKRHDFHGEWNYSIEPNAALPTQLSMDDA